MRAAKGTTLILVQVYAQVTDLFQGAPDLLDEFSQFLPTADGSQPPPGGLFGDFFGGGPPAPVPVATHPPETRPAPYEKQKRGAKNQEKETGGAKKRRMVDKEGKGRVSHISASLGERPLIPL